MNGHEPPVNSVNAGDGAGRSVGTALEAKVFDAELVTDDDPARDTGDRDRGAFWSRWSPRLAVLVWVVVGLAGRVWRSEAMVRGRSVAGYRARKAPVDVARLVWFVLRGYWRWLVKGWSWGTYADLRADARNARLAGDAQARRRAQELIRSDAHARWAKVGIVAHRVVVAVRVLAPVVLALWVVDVWFDRADMWPWLAAVYTGLATVWAVLVVVVPVMLYVALVVWIVAAAFEGRDKRPGVGWLIHPDRDDADSWIDERMISKALAHLGIRPLNLFLKNGGELIYTIAARKDGDGTYAQIRLPLGVTADMVIAQRAKLAANLGRAALEVWPTKGDEDGILDLWVADKGTLGGGAGDWPLLHDGQVDLFDGVPFGLTQRGVVINAPVIAANWLIGGRPGQGKSAGLRTLLLGAALDPTVELWVFVMGQSPDFDPFTPRLSRYRMGLDDAVAQAAVSALADLLEEMERRGRTLGQLPGRPPKVSRKLANRPDLGLHPLVCAIDECHELFQHPRYGKHAADLATRLIKRGRKYGITLLLATQSPTKDSIPREVTRNISCGAAFSVADQVANDGLLGSGKYRAGIRATDLRMHTDRGTCVAVGITNATFELVRTFYVPFDDEIDEVSPVITRAVTLRAQTRPAIAAPDQAQLEAAPVDHLADIATVLGGEPRVRTQVVLTRLAAFNPTIYEGWSPTDLTATLAAYGITPSKSHGVKVVRAEHVTDALRRRDRHGHANGGDPTGPTPGTRGVLPQASPPHNPPADLPKHEPGTMGTSGRATPQTPQNPITSSDRPDWLPDEGADVPVTPPNRGVSGHRAGSLPDTGGGGGHGD